MIVFTKYQIAYKVHFYIIFLLRQRINCKYIYFMNSSNKITKSNIKIQM